MNDLHKRRLIWVIVSLCVLAVAAGLVLYALKQNISLYYTPSQVTQGSVPYEQTFRMGGLVQKKSIRHAKNSLQVTFVVTDLQQSVPVVYEGILPDLFRDGQGVVVQGKLTSDHIFVASEVLAKHDEKYMPPPAQAALRAAKKNF